MTHPQVICVGEVLWDYLADQVGKSRSEVSSWTAYLGGAPANVACGLVKLSTPAALVSCVGQDADGGAILEQVQQLGVDISGIQRSAQATTRRVYVTRIPMGNSETVCERQFVGFGPLDTVEFADMELQAADLPAELFTGAQYLVLGTLGLAAPATAEAMQRAIDLAQQQGLGIVIDVNWRSIFWPDPQAAIAQIRDFIQQADLLKLSSEEAELFFETTDPAIIDADISSRPQSSASAIRGVVITLGGEGCRYSLAGQTGQLQALPVQTIDTTGAGDGFLAGLLHQLCLLDQKTNLSPEAVKTVITFASAVGALVTTKPGAIAPQPTAVEVGSFLSQLAIAENLDQN
jgi:fructokinase